MNLPRPETKRAILPSAGHGYARATRHAYAETKPVFEAGTVVGYEHIFVCTETNSRRRWGFEGRNPNQHGSPLEVHSADDELPTEIKIDAASFDAFSAAVTAIDDPVGHASIDPVTGGDM